MNNTKETRRRRTLKEWNEIKKNHISRKTQNEQQKKELQKLLSEYSEKDIRFFYIREQNYDKGIIKNKGFVSCTVIDKETFKIKKIKIAFSFCNSKDRFKKIEGKINCLKRLKECDKYVCTMNWSGNSRNDMFQAFNEIEKPKSFNRWKFFKTTFLATNRSIYE